MTTYSYLWPRPAAVFSTPGPADDSDSGAAIHSGRRPGGGAGRISLFSLIILFFMALSVKTAWGQMIPAGEYPFDSTARYPDWHTVTPGLELSYLPLPPGLLAQNQGTPLSDPRLILLRIDPEKHEFVLLMSSQDGVKRTLHSWMKDFNLLVATNASMYQKDGTSSIGLMRNREHVNNPKQSGRFGAFFVSDPLDPKLPKADILDRNNPKLDKLLSDYGTVFQSFRVLDPQGSPLWPADGPAHSLGLLGRDNAGKLFFIFSQSPLNPAGLGEFLTAGSVGQSLGLTALMYVEGGKEAGLLLRMDGSSKLWSGLPARNILGIAPGMLPPPVLPNVLGVRARR